MSKDDLTDAELRALRHLARPAAARAAAAAAGDPPPPDGGFARLHHRGLVEYFRVQREGRADDTYPGAVLATDRRGTVVRVELTAAGRAELARRGAAPPPARPS